MTSRSATNSEMRRNQSDPGAIAIFALTRRGVELAARISAKLPDCTCFSNSRYALTGMKSFDRLSDDLPKVWSRFSAIICIMSCGIAVRTIAPLLTDKMRDPAVVVVDQDGRFSISLVSGHIGGANALAMQVASITGGQAVITTASDLQAKPAMDLLAKKAGLVVENRSILSRVGAAVLDDVPLWIFDPRKILIPFLPIEYPFIILLPEETGNVDLEKETFRMTGPGVWVSEFEPPKGIESLNLRPLSLVIGVGCNRGTTSRELIAFIGKVLGEKGLSPLSIKNFASIDIKSDESGLLEAAKYFNKPIAFCSRDEIAGVSVPNPSETVARHVGAKSVCEASALWSAGSGDLLVPKQKSGNCTLAVARANFP